MKFQEWRLDLLRLEFDVIQRMQRKRIGRITTMTWVRNSSKYIRKEIKEMKI